jgi:RNA polymerase sigma factor (sigma-70 family)
MTVNFSSGEMYMLVGQDSETRATLLFRVSHDPTDPRAWAEFVTHYGRKIHEWCRAWGLQDADAWDVTQIVLLNLAARMREFRYDPDRSFRAWLKTLTRHAWINYRTSEARHCRASGDSAIMDQLAKVEAREDLVQRLSYAFDQELFQVAAARIRLRVEPHTWEAFRLLAVENWSGADVARHLGIKVATAFVARSKVMRMLRGEVAKLERTT